MLKAIDIYGTVDGRRAFIPASLSPNYLQGVVTTIDSIEAAATGVTMRSQGHGGVSKAVTRSRRFSKAVTRSRRFFQSDHKVTKVFPKRSQGHGGFSKRSQGHGGVSKRSQITERKGNHSDIVLRMRKLLSRILPCIFVTSCLSHLVLSPIFTY